MEKCRISLVHLDLANCSQLPSALQPLPLGQIVYVLEVKFIAVVCDSPKMIDASLTKCISVPLVYCIKKKEKRKQPAQHRKKPSTA